MSRSPLKAMAGWTERDNIPDHALRKRRAKSMSGVDEMQREQGEGKGVVLSPRKRLRRSLAPRKSILKASQSGIHGIDDATYPLYRPYENDTTTHAYTATLHEYTGILATAILGNTGVAQSNDEADAENANTTRRQSRRVSFAPTAQMREFTKDKDLADEDDASNAAPFPQLPANLQLSGLTSPFHPPAAFNLGSADPILASPSVTSSRSPRSRRSSIRGVASNGHRRRSSMPNTATMAESMSTDIPVRALSEGVDVSHLPMISDTTFEEGVDMSIVDTDNGEETTQAFKAAFIFPRQSPNQASTQVSWQTAVAQAESLQEQSMALTDDGLDESGMDLVGSAPGGNDDVTSAFASSTHLFGRPSLAEAHSPDTTQDESHVVGDEDAPREYAVPLGSEGIDEEAIEKARSEKIRNGTLAFYATATASSTSGINDAFRNIHSPDLNADKENDGVFTGPPPALSGAAEYADRSEMTEDGEMDMSVVQDTRRMSNVFATVFGRVASEETEGVENVLDGSPSTEAAKRALLTKTLGEQALAFLDEDEDDGGMSQATMDMSTQVTAPQSIKESAHGPPEHGPWETRNEEGQIYEPLPAPVFVPRATRLSVVPELAEEPSMVYGDTTTGNGNDVEDDETQDMQLVNASVLTSAVSVQSRRLSIAHPTPLESVATTAPATSGTPEKPSLNMVLDSSDARRLSIGRSPSPIKSVLKRRQSLASSVSLPSLSAQTLAPSERITGNMFDLSSSTNPKDVFGSTSTTPSASALPSRSPGRIPAPAPRSSQIASRIPAPAAKAPQSPGRALLQTTSSRQNAVAPTLIQNTPAQFPSKRAASPTRAASQSPTKKLRPGARNVPAFASGLTPSMQRMSSVEVMQADGREVEEPASPIPTTGALAASRGASIPLVSALNHNVPDAVMPPLATPHPTSDAPMSEGFDAAVEEGSPSMTLEQFLQMTDVQFMDTLLSASQAGGAHKARKSLIASRFAADGIDAAAEGGSENREPTLADQLIASGSIIPVIEAYRMMARELRDHLRNNSQQIDEIEDSANDDAPSIFSEYLHASDSQRAALDTQFKLTKTLCRLTTRNEWYNFRSNVMSELVETVLKPNIAGLESDHAFVAETRKNVEAVLPDLRSRAAALRAELESEKQKQAELDTVDVEHARELRAAIAEQNASLEDFRRANVEAQSHLGHLLAKTDELVKTADTHRQAIAKVSKVCDEVRFYTQGEMYRLLEEYDLLQSSQSWTLTRLDSTRIELMHRKEISLTLVLGGNGVIKDYEANLLDTSRLDETRRVLTAFLFDRLDSHIGEAVGTQAKHLLRRIGHLWTNARKLREELILVTHRYPVALSVYTKKSRPAPFLRAAVRVYCPTSRSEFTVTFELTGEEMASQTMEAIAEHISCTVDVKFGTTDRDELIYIIRDRIANGGQRVLLEACQLAERKYA